MGGFYVEFGEVGCVSDVIVMSCVEECVELCIGVDCICLVMCDFEIFELWECC